MKRSAVISQCIYCKERKNQADFNREHVLPRLFGTKYNSNYVLHARQVCTSCNTYFKDHMESEISIDSYEALLRVQMRKPRIGNGSKLGNSRLRITITDGPLTGVECVLFSDDAMPEGIRIEYCPAIGLIETDTPIKYKYYRPDELPVCSVDLYNKLHGVDSSIMYVGMSCTEATNILEERGYIGPRLLNDTLSTDFLFPSTKVETQVSIKIDVLLRRLAAKTIFNFVCYTMQREFVLNPRYDAFREFIRYGNNASNIIVKSACGCIKGINKQQRNDHVVGIGLTFREKLYLAGFVSWFGEMSYLFIITPIPLDDPQRLPTMKLPYAIYKYDSEEIVCEYANTTINWDDFRVIINDCT